MSQQPPTTPLPGLPPPRPWDLPIPDFAKIARCCEEKTGGFLKNEKGYYDCLVHPNKYGCEDGDLTEPGPMPVPPPGGGEEGATSDDCADCGVLNIAACLRCAARLLLRLLQIVAVNALFAVMLVIGILLVASSVREDILRR